MYTFLRIKIFISFILSLILANTHAYSSNWKRQNNIECSIKTNHPDLLASKPRCTSWTTNYQYQQTLYLKTNELIFYGKLELAQPGYFWSRKPDNFDVEFTTLQNKNLKCFGFWDGSGISSSIGKRHNLYGMICNLGGNEINISKRKEFLNHIYIYHKYVNVNPKPWIKTIVKNNINESNVNLELLNLLNAKKECKEIGFLENTKKFDNCVEMMK